MIRMTVGAFRSKGDDYLRPVATKDADDVAQEPLPDRLDFLHSLERAIRIVKNFKKIHPEFGGGVAKLKRRYVGQGA
jgi:hypothetical protein